MGGDDVGNIRLRETQVRDVASDIAASVAGHGRRVSRFVYIVAERGEVRESLRSYLTHRCDMLLVPVTSGDAFIETLGEREPGCVLLDVELPDAAGLAPVELLSGHCDLWPVVVVTGRGSVESAVCAMKIGAVDYLERPLVVDGLLAALDAAQQRIDRLSQNARGTTGAHRRFARLSVREREVVDALLDGNSNKQIAHLLSIGLRTVEVHRANIMAKLEVTSVAAMVRVALLASEPPRFR